MRASPGCSRYVSYTGATFVQFIQVRSNLLQSVIEVFSIAYHFLVICLHIYRSLIPLTAFFNAVTMEIDTPYPISKQFVRQVDILLIFLWLVCRLVR